ncbi:MAG: toxin-antitoxin system HicB family antitoxin [Brevundimonas sp.]|nr:MAG: toxin-antitoxin system HicB family antitoxin [Brevundimonas sp.]
MAGKPRKPFLMRASPGVMAAVEKLAAAELRSVNAQVEILLREALSRRGVPTADDPPPSEDA